MSPTRRILYEKMILGDHEVFIYIILLIRIGYCKNPRLTFKPHFSILFKNLSFGHISCLSVYKLGILLNMHPGFVYSALVSSFSSRFPLFAHFSNPQVFKLHVNRINVLILQFPFCQFWKVTDIETKGPPLPSLCVYIFLTPELTLCEGRRLCFLSIFY